MSDLLEKCEVCDALVDEEDLFCANCGTETPHQTTSADSTELTHRFDCEGCGASMSYDASAQNLLCPFCGSEHLAEQPPSRSLAARRVVPFRLQHSEAMVRMRQWLGRGFWRPGDLAGEAVVTRMLPVYVPYWVFEAFTFTYWTADTNQVPYSASGDWRPMAGEHHGRHEGVLVGASSALAPRETVAICPFDLAPGVPLDQIDLENATVEQFRIHRRFARPLAQEALEYLERQACRQYVPGQCRNLQVNVRLEGLSSEPVLLPVWVMTYRYKGRMFRFLLNGQTGKASGQAPFSWKKAFSLIGIVVAIAIAILLLFVFGAAMSR